MTSKVLDEPAGGAVELVDDFSDARDEGDVVGSTCRSGHVRLGVDIERVFSIDNRALRVAPLVQAGFGRAVLSYGPFVGRPGLAFAVFMLNGHNTAQDEPLSDTFRHRLKCWLRGSETQARWHRIVWWLQSARFKRALRQVRWWHRTAREPRDMPGLEENLAVGWYPSAAEPDPRVKGSGFVMHALGPENGELWAGEAHCRTRALYGVQNLPLYYIGVVRPEGTIYYVSSNDGAVGLAPYPSMRPIALDDHAVAGEVFLSIHQGVLGQVGFRLDTRAFGARVGYLEQYGRWWGGAHAAAALSERRVVHGACAEVGGAWDVWGAASMADEAGVLDPGAASGLVFASVVDVGGHGGSVGILCRGLDDQNHVRLEVCDGTAVLAMVLDACRETLAERHVDPPRANGLRYLQILDDGCRLMAYVDGEPLANGWIEERRLNERTKVGVLFCSGLGQNASHFRRFEAHPRLIPLPRELDMGAPWERKGTLLVAADEFAGSVGALDGRALSIGGGCWQRVMGTGHIDATGEYSAMVRASRELPCPDRTAYCIDWSNPAFADLEVTVTPSGREAGEKHKSMGGLILYQDRHNFLILNAYRTDYYPGGSVSTFFRLGGYEDVYDAIWSNVGSRVQCGKPLRLGLRCDGEQYLVSIDEEPVLYRALRDVYPDAARLQIRMVGIVANWEFGTDTGSQFRHFLART